MNKLENLTEKIKNLCKSYNLNYSVAKRDEQKSQNSFIDDKNDFRIYKRAVGTTVDERPHLSVWLYSNFVTVIFCVEDSNLMKQLDQLTTLSSIEVESKKSDRKHYKLNKQIDVNISSPNFEDDVIKQLDDLYNVVSSYL